MMDDPKPILTETRTGLITSFGYAWLPGLVGVSLLEALTATLVLGCFPREFQRARVIVTCTKFESTPPLSSLRESSNPDMPLVTGVVPHAGPSVTVGGLHI